MIGSGRRKSIIFFIALGIGMIVVVAPKDADAVSAAMTKAGEQVATIGTVVRASGEDRVVYDGALDLKL